MQIELVKYPQETTPHAFEAHVSLENIIDEKSERGRSLTVGRIRIYDEKSGKFSWFVIGARIIGSGQPAIEICNIRTPDDKTTLSTGKWRTPDAHDLARATNEAL